MWSHEMVGEWSHVEVGEWSHVRVGCTHGSCDAVSHNR